MKRRAFLLATMLCLIPIALVITFALSATLVQQSGMTVLAIRKNKAFYLGQAGLATAYHVFGLNNHAGHTHEPNGITQTSTGDRQFLETFSTPGLSLDGGWYRWQWSPGDPVAASFTRSGSFESYRFKVYLPTPQTWRIECEATADGVVSQQAVGGSIQGIYDYMVFDNGDSNDFSRAEQHRVTGKIHANGNLFLRPWTTNGFTIAGVEIIAPQEPANLDIDATQVSSAKRIVRFQDHQGNPDPGGNLHIGSSDLGVAPVVMEGLSQGAAGQGNAYDSYHPDWRNTAISKFGGIVTDSELGAKKLAIPQRGALEPGGYYDQRAGLRIDPTTTTAWCSDATFYNQNEARQVTVKEIDVAQMVSANQLPANGVIYSQVPIRLVNAHFIPQKLTIAAQGTIYTKGDFNKDNPDGTGPGQSQPAALLTTDRIYNLTNSFDDARSSQYFDPLNIADPPPLASDPPLFPGDDDNTLEINAALTDGAPTRDERAWIEGNPFHTTAQVPNLETGEPTGVLIVPDAHDPGSPGLKVTYPNSSDMLENLQQVRLRYRGSMSHMRNARMARFDHSDLASDPGLTPWIVKTSYLPPQDRSFEQDPRLNSLENGPPLQPRASRKLYWKEIR